MVDANRASPEAPLSHAAAIGHEFYVDEEACFDRTQRDAPIACLLSLTIPVPTANAEAGVSR